ncbi:MAG: DNA-directed RNA polymerase subunit omega [Ruminococcaceae bacterium]|nr:DNA-directed RNA polymerase subunit omega [Oscillospiraceae bacterium]
MMLYPSIMKLMEKTGSRYSLVIATAKRAREIEAAAQEGKNVDGARSISKAATEIADGTVVVFDADDADSADEVFKD